MPVRPLLLVWVIAFVACSTLAAISYGLMQSDDSVRIPFSYVLWPGVGLYTLLNGSLLFGGGFGAVGNFLVIALGSAMAWSLVVVSLAFVWVRVTKAQRR